LFFLNYGKLESTLTLSRFSLSLFMVLLVSWTGLSSQQFWSLAPEDSLEYLSIPDEEGRLYLDLDEESFQDAFSSAKGADSFVLEQGIEMILPNEKG
jgi:hypothetical protein